MAFVRIKRRYDENPVEALLLATKRQKTADDDEKTSVFKFTATVPYNEDDVIKYIEKMRKLECAKSNFKKGNHHTIAEDFINEHKAAAKKNRLEVVNCFRALDDESGEKPITVVDVVSNAQDLSDEARYVYDIYEQTNKDDVDDMLMERMCSVYAIDFDTGENDADDASEEYFDCSDDSNAESNWRNDYPDEDFDNENDEEDDDKSYSEKSSASGNGDHSIGEDDMIRAVKGMSVYDLSSEDYTDNDSESNYSNLYAFNSNYSDSDTEGSSGSYSHYHETINDEEDKHSG